MENMVNLTNLQHGRLARVHDTGVIDADMDELPALPRRLL